MAEYKTEKQVNYGWGLSLNMTGKAPAIAKRIFETLSDAQAYADDINDSAIAGLQLSVINDPDSSRNGIYFVKSIGDGTNYAILEQVGKSVISGETGSIDLSGYAKLSDINDVKKWVEEKNYLTEHQDISNLVTKDDFDKLEKSIPSLEGYAKTEDIPSLEGYARVEDMPSLEGYAKVEDIPSTEGFVTETWINNQGFITDHQILDGLVTKDEFDKVISEIPSLPSFTNGLEQTENSVRIKIDSESENFISTSDKGIKISGVRESIDEVVSGYLNTHSVNATIVYLNESEWDELRENVALGNASWENNVIYMIYSND